MTNVDESNLLNELFEAQEGMRVALGTISAIAIKCHPGAADIAATFTEWKWQKKRANALDVEVETLTARIAKLQAVEKERDALKAELAEARVTQAQSMRLHADLWAERNSLCYALRDALEMAKS